MTLSFDPATISLPRGHYIGGTLRDAAEGIPLRRPSDGIRYTDCPIASADLVDEAVETARKALLTSGWANLSSA